jgi:hypothetical protein
VKGPPPPILKPAAPVIVPPVPRTEWGSQSPAAGGSSSADLEKLVRVQQQEIDRLNREIATLRDQLRKRGP